MLSDEENFQLEDSIFPREVSGIPFPKNVKPRRWR